MTTPIYGYDLLCPENLCAYMPRGFPMTDTYFSPQFHISPTPPPPHNTLAVRAACQLPSSFHELRNAINDH